MNVSFVNSLFPRPPRAPPAVVRIALYRFDVYLYNSRSSLTSTGQQAAGTTNGRNMDSDRCTFKMPADINKFKNKNIYSVRDETEPVRLRTSFFKIFLVTFY